MSALEDAIKAELEDEESEGFPLVGFVCYAVRMNPADESLMTQVIVPEGQMFFSTIGMIRAAQMDVEEGSISYSWLLADDDDDE